MLIRGERRRDLTAPGLRTISSKGSKAAQGNRGGRFLWRVQCWFGFALLCFAKLVWLATTARAGPAGTPLPAQRPLVGYGLRPARDFAIDSPGEACPPSRLQCRGWVMLRTVMRSRGRSVHTFTLGMRIAGSVSVANRLALRGVDIRLGPAQKSVVARQSQRAEARFGFEVPRRNVRVLLANVYTP